MSIIRNRQIYQWRRRPCRLADLPPGAMVSGAPRASWESESEDHAGAFASQVPPGTPPEVPPEAPPGAPPDKSPEIHPPPPDDVPLPDDPDGVPGPEEPDPNIDLPPRERPTEVREPPATPPGGTPERAGRGPDGTLRPRR